MQVDKEMAEIALTESAGLEKDEADKLLAAISAAAEQEAFELLAGNDPIPSSLVDARALRLRYITERAHRALKLHEVEVILRVSPGTAQAALRRMYATYPRALDGYLKQVVAETGTVENTGNEKTGYRYQIYFDDTSGLEYAYQLLERRGLTHDVRVRRADQTLDLPRKFDGSDPLEVLGLPAPSA